MLNLFAMVIAIVIVDPWLALVHETSPSPKAPAVAFPALASTSAATSREPEPSASPGAAGFLKLGEIEIELQ